MMLVMSSFNNKDKSEISENCCPELEFDMWDGQFEFVGDAYDAGPTDLLKLPKIFKNSHDFDVQKVITTYSLFGFFFALLFKCLLHR